MTKEQEYAPKLWASLSANEKHGVRFGLFPHNVMKDAGKAGYDERKLCIALMQCASNNGGMRA